MKTISILCLCAFLLSCSAPKNSVEASHEERGLCSNQFLEDRNPLVEDLNIKMLSLNSHTREELTELNDKIISFTKKYPNVHCHAKTIRCKAEYASDPMCNLRDYQTEEVDVNVTNDDLLKASETLQQYLGI